MKSTKFIIALLFAVLPLMACGTQKANMQTIQTAVKTSHTQGNGMERRTLSIGKFCNIEAENNVQVIFTQSSTSSIVAEATPEEFDRYKIEVAGQTLHVYLPTKRSSKIRVNNNGPEMRLYVSAPSLSGLNLSGTSTFTTTRLTADKALSLTLSGSTAATLGDLNSTDAVNIDASGASKISMQKLDCRALATALSGAAELKLAQIAAKAEVTSTLTGACKMLVESINANRLDLMMYGSSSLESPKDNKDCKIMIDCSGETLVQMSGVGKAKMNLSAPQTTITASGTADVCMTFKGKEAQMECSGTATIEADLDCERLQAVNSGCGDMKMQGTADDVKISGSGVSHIDTSKLNKF